MLPLQDILPSRQTPWLTLTFIGVSALVSVYELTLSTPELNGLIRSHGLVPAYAWWRPMLTSLFISPGLLHTVANLFALWIFGDNVEGRLGALRYLGLLLVTGLLAALAGVWLDGASTAPLIGPAGAVAGVIGGHLALFPRARVLVLIPVWRAIDLVEVPSLLVVAFWLLCQGVWQFGGVTNHAPAMALLVMPLAGFVVGAAAAWALKRPERMRAEWWSP